MSAKQNLLATYSSWEEWTRREGLAIEEGDWRRLNECQKAKGELQARILLLTQAANVEFVEAAHDAKELERNLSPIIHSLIELERRNAERLADRRRAAGSQLAELDNTSRNLRRVQKSYVQPPQAVWDSYS